MEKIIEDLKKIERDGRELLRCIPGLIAMANPSLVTQAQAFVDGVELAVRKLEQLKFNEFPNNAGANTSVDVID